MIRPEAEDIILEGLRSARTCDGEPMSSHVHLLSVSGAIVAAFTAEGIDLDEVIRGVMERQVVLIDGSIAPTHNEQALR